MKVKPSHRLLVKSAILMPTAKEVTMVQVESEGYNKTKVTVPVCAMQGGADLQKYMDLLIPAPPATLKIIHGEGPIHLIGSHCVDYYGFKDDDETEDEDEDAEEEMETETTAEKGDVDKKTAAKEDKTTPSKEGAEKKTPAKEDKTTPSKEGAVKKTPAKEISAKKKTPSKA